jgi:RNA polymerase sigma-70 factor, ECF subfamily
MVGEVVTQDGHYRISTAQSIKQKEIVAHITVWELSWRGWKYKTMDEKTLISKAKQGNLDAYNQLVLIYQDAAYSYAYSITHDRQTAEDCTQDAFLKVYLHLHDYRGGSFRAYLFRIVRNACFDELRRSKRSPILPSVFQNQDGETVERLDLLACPEISVEEKIERAELGPTLCHHLEALPEKFRSVLVMVDLLEFDYVEASLSLNIPMGTLKSRLVRGRLKLSRSLQGSKGLLPQYILKSTIEEAIPL